MKTNKLLVFTTIALLVINLVLVYFLWNNKRDRGHGKERRQDRGDWIVNELKLDEHQKEEHKRIKDAHFAAMKPVFDSINITRKALYEQIRNASTSDSAILQYSQKIGSYHAEITRLTFDHFRHMRSILNPEQQVKLDTLVQKIVMDMGKKRKK